VGERDEEAVVKRSSKLGVTCIAFVGLVVISSACSSSDSPKSTTTTTDQPVTALRGTIRSAGGDPLAGVSVKAGAVSATSGADGRFELKAPAGSTTARFTKDGFVDGVRAVSLVDGRPTQLDVSLLPLAPAIPLDATAGGTVTGSRSARMVAPAGAFVDATGKPVKGSVNVHLTPLDPSVASERAAAPGFTAESGGATGMLESFGMVDVIVKQGDQRLDVASGKELELRIPAPAGATSPDASMPLWSFDEAKGVWVEEGVATYDASSKTYAGKAKHMSLWNADKVYLSTCICGLVKEKGGDVLPGARVDADGITYFGSSSANADANGKFCMAVRKDSDVSVLAYHKSGGGQARTIRSGSADTTVPVTVGDPRCVDVGVWEVERDVFVSNNGTSVACGTVGNPLASSCAAELGAAFGTCFKPEGTCVTTVEETGATTRYANGASLTSNASGGKAYSSSGQLCVTWTYEGGADASDSITIHYTLPDGRTFSIVFSSDATGDLVIQCPDGAETRLTAEQRQALEACGGNSQESANACTVEGGIGSIDGGGIPGACVDDTTCNGDVCCAIPNTTQKLCLPKATCDQIPQ
jgi:hypothetical protein